MEEKDKLNVPTARQVQMTEANNNINPTENNENNKPPNTNLNVRDVKQLKKELNEDACKFALVWKNIFYDAALPNGGNKVIINKVNGMSRSGELTAIMGPSGSGKTSLLNFLNDRIAFAPKSIHTGELFVNSEIRTTQQIADCSSYVMQDDLLFGILTPYETLMFTSRLRSKKTETEYKKDVDSLIHELKLTKCKDTFIGGINKKGISGGERKRVAIGVEIISDPAMLFLDEPTSGLDSQTSFIVIDFLKELAVSRNKMIILSIHQPSSNIFNLFNRLIVLNSGKEAYQGPPGKVIEYFNSIGMDLSSKANPADAFMHQMEEHNLLLANNDEGGIDCVKKYQEKLSPEVNREVEEVISDAGKCGIKSKSLASTGFCNEFKVLTGRAVMNVKRTPEFIKARFGVTLVFCFITCSIYYNLGWEVQDVFNKQAFFFYFTINNFMSTIFQSVLAFPTERQNFLREYAGKMYGVVPYFLAKNIVETVPIVFFLCLYGAIVYFIVGLRNEVGVFFTFELIYTGLVFMAQSVGLLFGTAFSNVAVALIITQFSVAPFFFFSGFIINSANMPVWLSWLIYFSPFRYSIEAGLRNEFDNNPNVPEELNPVTNFNYDLGMWNCIIIIYSLGFGLRILALIALKLLVRKVG